MQRTTGVFSFEKIDYLIERQAVKNDWLEFSFEKTGIEGIIKIVAKEKATGKRKYIYWKNRDKYTTAENIKQELEHNTIEDCIRSLVNAHLVAIETDEY